QGLRAPAMRPHPSCRPRESGDPRCFRSTGLGCARASVDGWVPACAGTTKRKAPLLRRLHLEAAREALGLELLGDQERELQRLAAVQARIAMRVIAAGEIGLADLARAADALGHVLPRHLEMHAARMGTLSMVHAKK